MCVWCWRLSNHCESDIVNNAGERLALIEDVGHTHLGLPLGALSVSTEEASLYDCFRQAAPDSSGMPIWETAIAHAPASNTCILPASWPNCAQSVTRATCRLSFCSDPTPMQRLQ